MGTTNGKVPGRVKYTFAFGALGKDLIYGMMATFAMIYFTDVLKVSPGFVGIVFFVAKLWDAFNDLFMGKITLWKIRTMASDRNFSQFRCVCRIIY